jgi:hypothetical protein
LKRVSELDYYNLRFNGLATKLGITSSQATALITLLGIKGNEDYAKIYFSTWCYSSKALERMREALAEKPIELWWSEYRNQRASLTISILALACHRQAGPGLPPNPISCSSRHMRIMPPGAALQMPARPFAVRAASYG